MIDVLPGVETKDCGVQDVDLILLCSWHKFGQHSRHLGFELPPVFDAAAIDHEATLIRVLTMGEISTKFALPERRERIVQLFDDLVFDGRWSAEVDKEGVYQRTRFLFDG